jgi:hypothetical protein|tara:strand:- start:346 stop:771 length:426 start_codon:yes stop_codon:yes gene_type:complete
MKNLSLIILLSLLIPFGINGQCRGFTKKTGRPLVEPYIHNGQMNSAVLFPGDSADIMLTFYSEQQYRLVICAEEQLGDVSYRVSDIERNVIFDSKESGSKVFDFIVESSQQLIISVDVPESKNTHDIDFQGCVAILVGFKN